MNRRQSLLALLALPAVASGECVPMVHTEPDLIPTDPRGFARWVAEWDLQAMLSNHPEDAHRRGYVSCFNWSPGRGVFVAVGPPDWLSDRAARVMAQLSEITPEGALRNVVPIVGVYRTPCQRALAIVIDGQVTEEFRAEFRRPLWHCGPRCESCG